MHYYVYIKEILGVETNMDDFGFMYGRVAPDSQKADFSRCKIRVCVELKKTSEVFDEGIDMDTFDRYNHFYAKIDENTIYYNRVYFGNAKFRFSVFCSDNQIKIVIGKSYHRLIKYNFMNLQSLYSLVSDFVCAMLLQNGYVSLHASAIRKKEKTLLICGPPSIGKTITAIELYDQHDSYFISEDIVITDGEKIYSIPWTSTFRQYNLESETKLDKLIGKINRAIPITQLIKRKKSLDSFLGAIQYLDSSSITDIILLGKGENACVRDKDRTLKSIMNLNRNLFNYYRSPGLLVMEYFNKSVPIDALRRIEIETMKSVFDQANTYIITSKDVFDYSKLIVENVLS